MKRDREKDRKNEREKRREADVRGANVALPGTWVHTHTAGQHKATHPQVSLLPGVAAQHTLKTLCTRVKGSLTGQGTHTHIQNYAQIYPLRLRKT